MRGLCRGCRTLWVRGPLGAWSAPLPSHAGLSEGVSPETSTALEVCKGNKKWTVSHHLHAGFHVDGQCGRLRKMNKDT